MFSKLGITIQNVSTTGLKFFCTAVARRKRLQVREKIRQIEHETSEAEEAAYMQRAVQREELKLARGDPVGQEAFNPSPFIDRFGRHHTYLRISLTEKCNLRCLYCMPAEGVKLSPRDHILTDDEIIRLVQVFAANGVDKIRLTGGEPSVRPSLVELIERIREVPGINSIGITTNGLTLHRKLEALKKAGLTKINISLDTLEQQKFIDMTRRNGLAAVWKTIEQAMELWDTVKLNNVVMRGLNDMEIVDFVELTKDKNLDVRFIEWMPFGGNDFNTKKFVSYREMLAGINSDFDNRIVRLQDGPNDTTKAYKVSGYRGQFGFITSMSEHFCDTCNRLRITADGNLKVCLHGNKEVSMRDLLRNGASEEEISLVVRLAVSRKKKQHAGCRHGKSATHEKQTNDTHRRITVQTLYKCTPKIVSFPTTSHIPSLLLSTNQLQSLSQRFYSITPIQCTNSNKLSHIGEDGSAKQVDVSHKSKTLRIAVAEGFIQLTPEISDQIVLNTNKKGDVLTVAKISSIMASKQTANIIPLCHNIPISYADTKLELNTETNVLHIISTLKTTSNTGVEMEALTAVSVAALTVFDMCKAVSSAMVIRDIRLVSKTGGKSNYKMRL